MWRHIERWEGSFLFRAHELEEARHDLTVVGLEMLKLGKEVVGHPCVLLTLVLVTKWDGASRRDKLLTGKVYSIQKWSRWWKVHLPHPGYPALQGELSHSHLAGRVEVLVRPEPK